MKLFAWLTAGFVFYLVVSTIAIGAAMGTSSSECDVAAVSVPQVSGRWTQQQISDLWMSQGGSTSSTRVSGVGLVPNPIIAGAVGMAESGGDAGIVNSIGAGGLMQIHPPQPNYLDPVENMKMAIIKWKNAKHAGGTGWEPWEAFTGPDARGDDGPWRTYLFVGNPSSDLPEQPPTPASCSTGGDIGEGVQVLPRQEGEWVVPLPGQPGESCDARIIPSVEAIISRYHVMVTDCYAPTGHEPTGEHPLGLATDLQPGPGGTWDDVDRLAADVGWIRSCGASGVRPACPLKPWLRFVGYDGYPDHGRGNHLHLSWEHGPGRPAETVTVPIVG